MTGGTQSDPSGPLPEPGPPTERAWQHPSEVGLATRGRTDRRRSTILAAGVVISGIGLLVTGVLMGASHLEDDTTTTTTPMDGLAESVAHVTVVRDGTTTMLTGLVIDDRGHILVPADAVADADELSARCVAGGTEEVVEIGRSDAANLAVLRIAEPAGAAAPTVDRPPRAGTEVVTVHVKGGMDLAVRSGTVESTAALTGTLLSVAPAMQAAVHEQTEDGRATTASDLAGGLVFDRGGRFIGMTRSSDAPAGSADMAVVDVMPARAAVAVARELIDGAD